ncbi:MAG: hypothetical protein K2N63_06450 [Lachnospiraceae bacterium]|nr:hypothetical protein [Lachnospiraceae bacterium]
MEFGFLLKIVKINLRHNFLPHLAAALGIALLAPVIFETSSLDAKLAAQPLEMFLCLVGAILFTPVFLPEQDENIRDLIRSKQTNYLAVCALRFLYSVFTLAAIIACFTLFMRSCESAVGLQHFFGAFASALFLGVLGFSGAGISGNVTVGYMVAMIYYIVNFTLKEKLGNFYLFSMSSGNGEGKVFLLAAALLLVVVVFEWKKVKEG